MKTGLTHDEALNAIVGPIGVTVMSYQEAIESYLMLRRLESLFTAQAATAFNDPQISDASVGRNPKGEDREDGLRAEHEPAVPSEDSGDAHD
jgi:hypothetical protein